MVTPRKKSPPPKESLRDNEDTRQKLIRAAKALFSTKGYDATTVKDLADHAGVNVSLVSYHFDGKEGLYRACLEEFGMNRLAAAQRVLQNPASVEEFRVRLQMLAEEVLGCHIGEQGDVCRMIHRECDMQLSIAEDIFKNTFLKIMETLVGFFQAAQKAGIVRADRDPSVTAFIFYGSLIHVGRTNHMAERFLNKSLIDPKYRAQVIQHVVSGCLEGCVDREKL